MKRRFLIKTNADAPYFVREFESLIFDGPHEVIVQPFQKRISASKQAVLHVLLRALADHTGYSVGGLKALLAQDGEWPLETLSWKGKTRKVRKETMSLTDEETHKLIATVEQLCIDMGVQFAPRDNWQGGEA